MTDEQNGATEPQPTCIATWKAPGSAEIEIQINNCSPAQLYSAAALIERYADELYGAGRAEQAAAQMREQIESQRIAQELMGGPTGKIVPVHGHIKRSDA